MAATSWPNKFNGCTITFLAGGAGNFCAELLDVTWGGIERVPIDLSSADTTGAKDFAFSPKWDPGEMTVSMRFDAAKGPSAAEYISGSMVAAAETTTLNFQGAGLDSWAATGALTGFEVTGSDENTWDATATIKFSGEINVTISV